MKKFDISRLNKTEILSKLKKTFGKIPRSIKRYYSYHVIARHLTILFVILVIANCVRTYFDRKALSDLKGDIQVEDYDTYLETLKDVPSDIAGKSQYDKYKMGLDYADGSDSDQDGLTDKEEIEVYGTDPLKSSTMEDLYSDGYKVKNNMDPKQKYEYAQDRAFEFNQCDEVSLDAESANDFKASVVDCSGEYGLDNWGIEKVYKGYSLSNFSGKFMIDVSSILADNDIDISDLTVYTYDGSFLLYGRSDLEKCKFTEDGSRITLKYDFKSDHDYYVFVTGGKSLINSLINSKKLPAMQVKKNSGFQYLIVNSLFHPTVYYPKLKDAEEKAFFDYLEKTYARLSTELPNLDYKTTTNLDIQTRYNIYSSTFPYATFDFSHPYVPANEATIGNIIPYLLKTAGFSYQLCDYDGSTSINAEYSGDGVDTKGRKIYNNYHTKFDPYVDEFSFGNFGSKYAKGNCAGICYLTTYLANKGSFPKTGSYGDVSWDLTTDSDNKTLMDPGLADYKTEKFIKKKAKDGVLDQGLTKGERQFVDLIGACWKKSNDAFNLNKYRINNQTKLSWDTAEAMIKQLDAGKVITISLLMYDGTGHELVLYDYYWIDDQYVNFRVYDPNIPQNREEGFTLTCDGACYLQCKKVANGDGTYRMRYVYWPIEESFEYYATNDYFGMEQSAIIVSDETLKIYNHR